MPKYTFFNLSQEKKDQIMNVAIDAFSTMDYDLVSITNLVKQAKIAKGSFYQYFEDKFDLYKYIVDLAGEKKKQYFLPVFETIAEDDFFKCLGKMYKAGLLFNAENPKFSAIGTRLIKRSDNTLIQKVYADMYGQVEDFMAPLLEVAVKKGEIRADVDLKFLSFFYGQFNMILADYFFNVENKDSLEDYMSQVDVMLDLFKRGVATEAFLKK